MTVRFWLKFVDCARNCARELFEIGLLPGCSLFQVGIVYDVVAIENGPSFMP